MVAGYTVLLCNTELQDSNLAENQRNSSGWMRMGENVRGREKGAEGKKDKFTALIIKCKNMNGGR